MREFFFLTEPTIINRLDPKYRRWPDELFYERLKEYIEQSPYYWWWYALTLNEDYIQCCAVEGAQQSTKVAEVYKDFGDVRYEGNKHEAFAKWWSENIKLKNTDPIHINPGFEKKVVTRGEYLFAEPMNDGRVNVLDNPEEAQKAANSDSHLIISVPLFLTQKYAYKKVNEVLEKYHLGSQPEDLRDVSKSKAKYKPSIGIQASTLKTQFAIFEMKRQAIEEEVKLTNPFIALTLEIPYTPRSTDEKLDEKEILKRRGGQVSKMNSALKKTIENVAYGVFP